MNFTTNTKPLTDALDLGIINSNVSNFHKKSTIVQITADKSELRINIEASLICTEIVLKGSGDSDEPVSIFVGSLMLKQLLSTIDTPTVTLEFVEGGLVIHSGKSRFTLPKMVDADELELTRPVVPNVLTDEIDIDKSDWKFIKDNQMYAIAMSFIHPVYTRVWIGDSGDVLVGDFDNSLFTHSKRTKFGTTCLLSDTIINLFNSLPDGAKLIKTGKDYLIQYISDSFNYCTQFTPLYEDDENVGSYQSDIFLDMMEHPDEFITVSAPVLNKFLSQAELLSNSTEDVITLVVEPGLMQLKDDNVDCKVEIGTNISPYSLMFKIETLHRVISNYGDEEINIAPKFTDDEIVGILIWDENLTTVIAGVD